MGENENLKFYPSKVITSLSDDPTDNLQPWPRDTQNKEPDMRQCMTDFLYGSATLEPHGIKGLIRRVKRDSNGELILCPCVDLKTHEPDVDSPCPVCLGQKFIWEEKPILYSKSETVGDESGFVTKERRAKPGILNVRTTIFYLEWFVNPSIKDQIIQLNLDLDGNVPAVPQRFRVYKIATAEDFRSDNGRVEYWRCACYQEGIRTRGGK